MAKKIIDEDSFEFKNVRTEDIENYVVEDNLDATSTNPIQNKAVANGLNNLSNNISEITARTPVFVDGTYTDSGKSAITSLTMNSDTAYQWIQNGNPLFLRAKYTGGTYESIDILPCTSALKRNGQPAALYFRNVIFTGRVVVEWVLYGTEITEYSFVIPT